MFMLLSVFGLIGWVMVGPRFWRVRSRRLGWGLAGALLFGVVLFSLRAPVPQKVLGRLIMPAGWIWLSLFAVGLAYLLRQRRWEAGIAFGLFGLYGVGGNQVVGAFLMESLQNDVVRVDPYEGPPYEALLVLGGGTKPGPYHPEFGTAGDRVALAARLFHAGRAPILVASGRSLPGLPEALTVDLSKDTQQIWTGLRVPQDAIVRLPDPHNTQLEMQAYRQLIETRGWRRVGLISSGYHLPRAMRHARRLGLHVVPIAADHHRADAFSGLSLVPQGSGFFLVERAVWEYVGRAVGR